MFFRDDTISSFISEAIKTPARMGGIEYVASKVEADKRLELMDKAKAGSIEAIEILKRDYGMSIWISEGVRIF